MDNILKLISPIPISVNHYLKPRSIIKNGKPMVIMYETTEAKKYKKDFINYIKQEILNQKIVWTPNKTQHFHVDAVFYFERIDQDCNNYWKLLLDSITDSKSVWIDDNVALERVKKIMYDNKNPHIELSIYPVEYIGIFDNREQFNDFENNCVHCMRYKERKCSIYRRASEGRIQDDIQGLLCLKYKKKSGGNT